jgi:hypothetical protein
MLVTFVHLKLCELAVAAELEDRLVPCSKIGDFSAMFLSERRALPPLPDPQYHRRKAYRYKPSSHTIV